MWILGLVLTHLLGPVLPSDTTVSYVVDAVVVRAAPWDRTLEALPMTAREVRWTPGEAYHALAEEPGLVVKDYIQFQGLSVRGSSSEEVKVLFEGFPFQPQQSGFTDLGVLPQGFLGSAEVVRTANATYFGAGAMAGLVNFQLPPPKPGLRIGTGTLRPWALTFQMPWTGQRFSGQWGGAWEVQANHFWAPDPEGRERVRVQHAGGWKAGLFTELWTPWGRSLLLTGWARRATPWLPWSSPQPDTLETRYFLWGWEAPSLRLSAALWHTLYHAPTSQSAEHREGQFQAQWHRGPWLFDLTWTGLRSSTLGVRMRSHVSPGFRQTLPLGRVYLFLAFRLDVYSTPRQVVPTGFLGLRWPLGFYLSLSRGFRPPTFNELYWPEDLYAHGNPHLRPETSIEIEAGWKLRRPMHALSLALYRRAYQEMIRWSPDATGKWRPINLHDVAFMGFEAQGEFRMTEHVSAALGGEWIFWHHGPNLIYTPLQTAYMEFRVPGFWIRWAFIGPRPERLAGPKRLPGFHLLDLGAHIPLWRRKIHLSLTLQNALNQPVQWVRGYPSPGRTWQWQIEWQPNPKRR